MGPCVQVMFPATSRTKEYHHYFPFGEVKYDGNNVTASYKHKVPTWANSCYHEQDDLFFDTATLYSDDHYISFPEFCPMVKGNIYVGDAAWHVKEFGEQSLVIAAGAKSAGKDEKVEYVPYEKIKCINGKASVAPGVIKS